MDQIITIPLHPFSYKILKSTYGGGDIRINMDDPISSILLSEHKRSNKLVSDPILTDIYVSIPIMNRVRSQVINASYAIYIYHRDMAMMYILGQYPYLKNGAKEAIYRFYDLHDITPEDLDTEAIYRAWTRWRSRNHLKRDRIDKCTSRIVKRKQLFKSDTPLDILDAKMGHMVKSVLTFKNAAYKSIIFNRDLISCMVAYVYRYHGMKSRTEVARIMDRHPDSITKKCTTYRKLVDTYNDIRDVHKLLFGTYPHESDPDVILVESKDYYD